MHTTGTTGCPHGPSASGAGGPIAGHMGEDPLLTAGFVAVVGGTVEVLPPLGAGAGFDAAEAALVASDVVASEPVF